MSDTPNQKEIFISYILMHDTWVHGAAREQAGWTIEDYKTSDTQKRKFYSALYDRLLEVASEVDVPAHKREAAGQLIRQIGNGLNFEISFDDFDERRSNFDAEPSDGPGIFFLAYGARDFGNLKFENGFHRFAQPISEIVDGVLAFYQLNNCNLIAIRPLMGPKPAKLNRRHFE